MTDREAFEAWARSQRYIVTRDKHGDYHDPFSRARWETWQAGRAQALESRDKDWVLAMGYALGLESGFNVPIVPEQDPFRSLFDAVRAQALEEAAKICERGAAVSVSLQTRIGCARCAAAIRSAKGDKHG